MSLGTIKREVTVTEGERNWSILWPTGETTEAPAAAAALQNIRRADQELSKQVKTAVIVTAITWNTNTL